MATQEAAHRRTTALRRGRSRSALPLALALVLILTSCSSDESVSPASPSNVAASPAEGPLTSPAMSTPEAAAAAVAPVAQAPQEGTDSAPVDQDAATASDAPAAEAPTTVTASAIEPGAGGSVTGPDGVSITVPPAAVQEPTNARITPVDEGVYDIHIDGPWTGTVQVKFPLVDGMALIAHQRDGEWILEDAQVVDGMAVANVQSLSLFSNLGSCMGKLIRPSKGAAVSAAKCLARLGVKKLPEWAAKKLIGVFNDYDACEPFTVNNWSIDWYEIITTPCRLSEPTPPPAPAPTTAAPAPPAAVPAPAPVYDPPAPAAPTLNPSVSLAQGGGAQYGWWYSVRLSGFAPGAQIVLTCADSADPGGFYEQAFTADGNGAAGDDTLCYSGDGPDHWVSGGGVESNHVTW